MPDLPISGLTAGNPAQSADLLPADRSGSTIKITAGSIAALASSATLQTNSVDNSDQTVLNFEDTASVTWTAATGGVVKATATQVSFGLTLPSWWMCCDGSNYAFDGSNGQFGTGTANEIQWWYIRVPYSIEITTATFRFNAAGSGGVGGMAIYDSTGQTKLLSFDNFAFSGGARAIVTTNTGGGTVTLTPGIYVVACSQSTTGTSATSQGGYKSQGTSDVTNGWNANVTPRSGISANPMGAGGILPSALGTLSLSSDGPRGSLPCVCFEP